MATPSEYCMVEEALASRSNIKGGVCTLQTPVVFPKMHYSFHDPPVRCHVCQIFASKVDSLPPSYAKLYASSSTELIAELSAEPVESSQILIRANYEAVLI